MMNVHKKRFCLMVLSVLLLGLALSCRQSGPEFDVDRAKTIAGELRDTKLYEAAIEEYEAILEKGQLDDKARGNINYLIAKIYFEDLQNYRQAAAYYVRARSLDPEGSYMTEASKNLVASLEKLGQIVDARRELGAAADVDPVPRTEGDVPVAIISSDTIWLSEVDAQIQQLPAQMQEQYVQPEAKADFVRQYAGTELLYRAALREGYDRDAEIIRDREMLFKRLLVEKFVSEKVMPELKIDTADVHNYYVAHRDSLYAEKPYDSVRYQVYMDYQQEKAQAAYSDYIGRLIKAENVRFLDHNIR